MTKWLASPLSNTDESNEVPIYGCKGKIRTGKDISGELRSEKNFTVAGWKKIIKNLIILEYVNCFFSRNDDDDNKQDDDVLAF